MFNLCHYKDILGKPGKGVHKYRVYNIAIVDVIFTVLLAIVIKQFVNYNLYLIIFFCFLSAIILHRLFCVRTTIDKLLF
jgi:hypothetical protein